MPLMNRKKQIMIEKNNLFIEVII